MARVTLWSRPGSPVPRQWDATAAPSHHTRGGGISQAHQGFFFLTSFPHFLILGLQQPQQHLVDAAAAAAGGQIAVPQAV